MIVIGRRPSAPAPSSGNAMNALFALNRTPSDGVRQLLVMLVRLQHRVRRVRGSVICCLVSAPTYCMPRVSVFSVYDNFTHTDISAKSWR